MRTQTTAERCLCMPVNACCQMAQDSMHSGSFGWPQKTCAPMMHTNACSPGHNTLMTQVRYGSLLRSAGEKMRGPGASAVASKPRARSSATTLSSASECCDSWNLPAAAKALSNRSGQ